MVGATEAPRWLLTLTDDPRPGEPVIVLVHAVSGSVMPYGPLSLVLEPPTVGIEARGLHGFAPDATITDAAEAYAHAVSGLPGPVLVVGWSLGGSLAFEVAGRLGAAGRVVVGAVLVDADPDWLEAAPPPAQLVDRYLADVFASLDQPRPDDARVREDSLDPVASGWEVIRRHRLAPAAAQQVVRRRIEVFCALASGFAAYRPVVRDVTVGLVSTGASAVRQRQVWSELADVREQTVLAADHYGVLRPPYAATVAAVLHRWCSRVRHDQS